MFDKTRFGGIFPALLTPFDKNDRVNAPQLEALMDFCVKCGAKGFFVGGSTSEVFMMTASERVEAMEICVRHANGLPMIAHIGSVSTSEAVSLARKARELGYDAVSAVPPFYYKFSFAEMKKYFFDIAEGGGLPVFIYNIPVFTNIGFTADQFGEFLSSDLFAGVKFTSTDVYTLGRIAAEYPDKMIYCGYDEMFLPALTLGAGGAVGSSFNYMTDKFAAIYDRFTAGDLDGARKKQAEANRVIAALSRFGGIAAAKEIMCQLGFDFGEPRPPFLPLDGEGREYIRTRVLPMLTARR